MVTKSYKEISAVVLFAILVHTALTASLVNMFMSLHGAGGGSGIGGAGRVVDTELYSSDLTTSTASPFDVGTRRSLHETLSKKKMPIIDENISLEVYSFMLTKHRLGINEGGGDVKNDNETTMADKRHTKQSKQRIISAQKFRYMR
jgi:hypothetical protein